MISLLQQAIINEVRNTFKDEDWFRGVCLDNLPTDQEILNDWLDSLSTVETNTIMFYVAIAFDKLSIWNNGKEFNHEYH